MLGKNTIFKRYRLFLVVNGQLCWWGSYHRKGNALRYLKESGPGLRVMLEYDELWVLGKVTVMIDGVVRDATEFESALVQSLPVNYSRWRW